MARRFYKKLLETEKGMGKIKRLRNRKINL